MQGDGGVLQTVEDGGAPAVVVVSAQLLPASYTDKCRVLYVSGGKILLL